MTTDSPARLFPLSFHYHRGIAPMMWVLIGLSGIELLVVHFLLAFWNRWVAMVASVLTVATIVWLVALIRSMRKLPVLMTGNCLVMRVGSLRRHDIDLSNIAAVRTVWETRAEKAKPVSNLALIAYPNVMIDLSTPLTVTRAGRQRQISTVAHRLDDLPGFLAALNHGPQP